MTRTTADWITIAEAAEILAAANVRFAPATLARWARSGRLQSIKIGGRRYVHRAEVRGLLRPRGAVAPEDVRQPGLFEDL
jgi:excisionase family DNA binding protein